MLTKPKAQLTNGLPSLATTIKKQGEFETMKNIDLIDNTVTIKTTLKENDIDALKSLADEILK